MKKIRRFPRLAEDFPELMEKKRYMGMDISGGRVPRGYDRVTKKQKRAARLVINGMTIRDVCSKLHVDSNTWYRWMNLNEKFKSYYIRYARKQADHISGRLDAKVGRAVRVVEDSLDSQDPYFAADQAVKLLSGRGHYTKKVESNQKRTGVILHAHAGKIQHEMVDKELMLAFVEAMTGRAIGPLEKKEKVINAKVLKSLPEPKHGLDSEIPKSVEAETV